MKDIEAIIFDCFGVLYPQPYRGFFEKHKDKFGNDRSALDNLNLKIDLGQINRAVFFAELEKIVGVPADKIQEGIDKQFHPDTGLAKLITRLKTKYKIGLLSNAGEEEISILYRDKLDTLFDAITISYEVGMVKPGTDIYRICTEQLGVQPETCLYVDDSTENLEPAERLGMKTLYYPDFGVIPMQLREL